MNIVYTIHNNFDHCYADFLGEKKSYFELKNILTERGRVYIKNNRVKQKSHSVQIKFSKKTYDKSSLTDDQLENYFIEKKKAKAKSWLSSQRRLRRQGKLSSKHIEMLNELGMLWNPNDDPWEKNFILFQEKIFVNILKEMRKKEIWISKKKLDQVCEIENWMTQQRNLYLENKLSLENLTRLKAINFPFEISNDEKEDLKLSSLAKIVNRIVELRRELSIYGSKAFAKRFSVKEKVYVGAPIKISEETIYNSEKKERKNYEEESKRDNKYSVSFEKENQLAQENALNILKEKKPDYFIKHINKISRKYTPTKDDKEIYEIDKKNKKTAWGNADERLAHLYFDRYQRKYKDLGEFLNNKFLFPRTTINNIVYEEVWVKFDFDSIVKIYAANKMLEILDKYLIKNWLKRSNNTRFKPISFLITHYQKQKNLAELVVLRDYIEKHQMLSLVYAERVVKIINKLR